MTGHATWCDTNHNNFVRCSNPELVDNRGDNMATQITRTLIFGSREQFAMLAELLDWSFQAGLLRTEKYDRIAIDFEPNDVTIYVQSNGEAIAHSIMKEMR